MHSLYCGLGDEAITVAAVVQRIQRHKRVLQLRKLALAVEPQISVNQI